MKRVTTAQLEQLIAQSPGSQVDEDDEAGVRIVTVKRSGQVYYASLPTEETAS